MNVFFKGRNTVFQFYLLNHISKYLSSRLFFERTSGYPLFCLDGFILKIIIEIILKVIKKRIAGVKNK